MKTQNKKKTVSAVCSALVWGSGQFLICKQRAKGALFFLLQIMLVGIEMVSGYWPEYLMGAVPHFSIRLHGGFFTKGIWGLVTLGEVRRQDHSTMLLVEGIIAVIFLILFLCLYLYNIIDAYKTAAQYAQTGIRITSREYFATVKSKGFAYIVLLPIVLLFALVVVMPIVSTVLIAFTNYNRQHIPPGNLLDWVGLSNFKQIFTVPIWSGTFMGVLVWTVVWAVLATFLSYILGLLQATILSHPKVKGKRIFQTIMILPWAVPNMISLLYFSTIFNGQFGPVNKFLSELGLIDQHIPFFTDPLIAKIVIIVTATWLGFPVFMVMIRGVLSSMDTEWREAATLDGATSFQVFRHITLPHVLLSTAPLLVMNLAGNFNNFGLIYFLTDGGPVNFRFQFAGDTDILISWVYELTLNQQMYNMAAVMSLLIFLFIGIESYWNIRRTTSFKEL